MRNKIVKLSVLGSGAILILCLIIFGFQEGNYWVPMIIILLYMLVVLIVVTFFKYRSSQQMRVIQFLLSVLFMAENNRFYLKNFVELRPGFLGKWIEFNCMNEMGVDDIINQMRQRFLKPCLEQKAALFDKAIMGETDLRRE